MKPLTAKSRQRIIRPGLTLATFLLGILTSLPGLITPLVATAATQAAASPAPTPKVLRIAAVARDNSGRPSFIGVPQRVAEDTTLRKALNQRGIRIEWVPVTAAAVATLINESFANQRIDFAFYGDLPSVILNANGIATRLVVPGSLGNNTYLIVPKGSTATRLRNLKGKRIALHRGRPWEVSFGRLAAAEGLGLKDFRIINLNPQAGSAALAAGNIDALFTLSDAWLLQDKQLGRIIWSSQKAAPEFRMRAELWGAAGFIAAHPDITQDLVNATLRATYWVAQEKNRDAYFKEQALFGQPESVARRDSLGNSASWKDFWSPDFTPGISAHYRRVIDHARQNGLIRTDLQVESLLAPQFLTQALKTEGLTGYWKKNP